MKTSKTEIIKKKITADFGTKKAKEICKMAKHFATFDDKLKAHG